MAIMPDKIWRENGCPANIVLGEPNLDCFGAERKVRYGHPGSRSTDNIHLRGKFGKADWTDSVIKTFKLAFTFLQQINLKHYKKRYGTDLLPGVPRPCLTTQFQ